MKQYRLGFIQRNFGHNVCMVTAVKKSCVKIMKFVLPAILILAGYVFVGFIDTKAEASIAMSQQQMDAKIDVTVSKQKSAEDALVNCLNGVGVMIDNSTYVDCSKVKTLTKKETEKMLAEDKKYRDSLVLPALYWSNPTKDK